MNGLEDISGHTSVRMDGRDSLGLQRIRRETKKIANSNERIAKKMRKTSIFGHFGSKWPIFYTSWPKWAKRELLKKKRLKMTVFPFFFIFVHRNCLLFGT